MAGDGDTSDKEDDLSRKERLTLWLDFGKWLGGTFMIGVATIAVNWIIKDRELELARVEQEGARVLAELEQQRVFLESFVSQAMEQDVRVRLRLAHYIMKTTLNDDIRMVWEGYYEDAFNECVRIHARAQATREEVEAECRFGGAERIEPPAEANAPQALPEWLARLRRGPQPPVTLPELERAARELDVVPAVFHALLAVEATGSGFVAGTDLPTILFEGHLFSRYTNGAFDTEYPTLSYSSWTPSHYVGGRGEYDRMLQAGELDLDAALRATSWGRFQVMGLNFENAGFETLQAFVSAQFTTAGQLDTIIGFLKSAELDAALRERRWTDFARAYNGPGYERNGYHTKLAAAYDAFDPGSYPPEQSSPSPP